MLCWGNASYGQLGLGGIDEEIIVEPRQCEFFTGKVVRDVGCGRRHTVFLLEDGTVYTCGCNDLGQLGHEKTRKKPEQVMALDAQNIVAVSCGEAHTLALNDKGQVFAWGQASDGQLGLTNIEDCMRVPRTVKSLSEVHVVQVSCGYRHSLALSQRGHVFSWGQNRFGQLGLGKEGPCVLTPQIIQSLQGIPFAQISAGGAHSFALTMSGAVFGWGRNKFGQLGLNDNTDEFEMLYCVKRIYAGGDQSFAHFRSLQDGSPPDDLRIPHCNQHILHLNEELVQKWLSHAHGSHKRLPAEMTGEIDDIFSSASCLNGSFLSRSHPDHYGTSTKCSGVDMNAARLLFHRLIQPDCPQISQQVADSLGRNLIPSLCSSPPDIEVLRLYLILPECPLFKNPSVYITLTIPFAQAVIQLSNTPLKVLGNWWSRLEPSTFQGLVELYKEVIVYLLRMKSMGIAASEHRTFTCFLSTCLKFLEILHSVNERAGQIIQYDKFYIHELEDLVDIRSDYVTWFQHQMFSSGMDSPVTLCKYPFVFDAQAKTLLLQTDAVIQMQMAVDQAERQNFSSLFLPDGMVESVNPCLILIVRRENLVEDTMEVLRKSKNVDYKKPLKVMTSLIQKI
ncbi:putative E3 ubiquitin-protein ligase HERC4 [Bagarius yarrelli]|uniref:Putative E3 ubiquitin-protein ligase HERC4 n=1 Tax=Bagarius yarrelli TaxID=175774 RepID=A0A556VC31_BAGYA|nr:putative E3 ubiquitin-protein ligase HERC4 [Bagarius yarrelli]